ncbi:MAG: MBL fold metallo-hydrolase [Erysipelotrichaceae bacterium]|nr:MBL fold metallo-hydrolase [Erysipelotrichaceae bacterium]
MKLEKLTDDICIYPFEPDRDRPTLSLIRGFHRCLAVDAGHSREHVGEFYHDLKESGLPLPDITVLTHWHWDHSFALHAISGVSVAERRTRRKLREAMEDAEFIPRLLSTDEYVAREYENRKITISLPDIVFDESLDIDLGGLHAHCFHVPSSHTNDCTCILIPERGVLYLGDCISGAYPDWIIDPLPFEKLIETLEMIDFTVAVGSHWPPFSQEELLAYLRSNL